MVNNCNAVKLNMKKPIKEQRHHFNYKAGLDLKVVMTKVNREFLQYISACINDDKRYE